MHSPGSALPIKSQCCRPQGAWCVVVPLVHTPAGSAGGGCRACAASAAAANCGCTSSCLTAVKYSATAASVQGAPAVCEVHCRMQHGPSTSANTHGSQPTTTNPLLKHVACCANPPATQGGKARRASLSLLPQAAPHLWCRRGHRTSPGGRPWASAPAGTAGWLGWPQRGWLPWGQWGRPPPVLSRREKGRAQLGVGWGPPRATYMPPRAIYALGSHQPSHSSCPHWAPYHTCTQLSRVHHTSAPG